MNVQETKNIVRQKKQKNKKPVIIAVALVTVLAIVAVFAFSLGSQDFTVDTNRDPSRGLSFDKTSVVSKTYMLVGIGLCKDKDIVVQASKDGMPVTAVGDMAFRGNKNIRSIARRFQR